MIDETESEDKPKPHLFVKGHAPIPGSGRAAGSISKRGKSAKAAIEAAFEAVGGVRSLVEWAHDEPTEFYKIWSKLLPRAVDLGAGGGQGSSVQIIVQTGVPQPKQPIIIEAPSNRLEQHLSDES